MNKYIELIDKYKTLNVKYSDVSHPDKLDLINTILNELKQDGKLLTDREILNKIIDFLMSEIHKVTSKDTIRKPLIRSVNTVAKYGADLIDMEPIKRDFVTMLNRENSHIDQRLFVFNLYLENLDNLGCECIRMSRDECLEFFASWNRLLQTELMNESSTPIVIAKNVTTLQLLFKTMIVFVPKYFTSSDLTGSSTTSDLFKQIQTSIEDILHFKDVFSLELGYSTSVMQTILILLQGQGRLKTKIQEILNQSGMVELRELCFFQAVLSILKVAQFNSEGLIEVFEQILLKTLNSTTESTDSVYCIAVSRTIHFWILKLIEMSSDKELMSYLIQRESQWFPLLLQFVWLRFDSNIDVIKNANLQNYKHLLQIVRSLRVGSSVDEFYADEIAKCLALNWQANSKLHGLILLVDNGIKASHVLQSSPRIASELIEAITERSSACLVADLYISLMRSHQSESNNNDESWLVVWWSPIAHCLDNSNDKVRKGFLYEYVLPKIMKTFPDATSRCIKMSNSFAALISCAKICRSIGLASSQSNDENSVYGVDIQVIERSVVHFDEQIRLDSLGLVCENPKTTEPIRRVEFELIKKFLSFNSDIHSPSYRQTVIASMKKLFIRFKESWLNQAKARARGKRVENDESAEKQRFDNIDSLYKDFIDWMLEFVLNSLHLDSTYALRNQILMLLKTFVDIVGLECSVNDAKSSVRFVLFNLESHLTRSRLLTLIECLWDTYAVNKDIVIELLFKLDPSIFKANGIEMKSYYKIAIDLLSSRRPVDSVTSVYLILFIQRMVKSVSELTSDKESSVNMFLIESVVKEFRVHCDVAKRNLLHAALLKPIYGPLGAARSIILHSISDIKAHKDQKWKELIDELIELCFEVSKVVSAIVNSSSPEGIFPDELASMQPETLNDQEASIKSVTPQMLLVCCWRTMKEISLTFGDLIQCLPFEHESSSYILSNEQVNRIGSYFVKHLFETRHRGAFELAYVGFTSMCQTFWKCKSDVYCKQPIKWLDHVLELIQTDEAKSKLFSTRRGGGLPFYIQAIVSTELAENGHKSLEKCMQVLLNLAKTQDLVNSNDDTEEANFSKVLSMYILSALFKDTRLGESMLQYAEQALIVAIAGFDSIYWNVRNCSTILFSSLMNRIFGVNRSKEEISKKNSMPGRMFFARFPLLFDLFTNIMTESIDSMSTNLNAKLYLVVLMLCHLFTMTDDSDPEALLHTFIPYLIKCCNSPVMKTRCFIAKSISSIVNMDRYTTLVQDVLDSGMKQLSDQNGIHGMLEILHCLVDKHDIFKQIEPNKLIQQLESLITSYKHVAVNYGSLINLINKLYYKADVNRKPLADLLHTLLSRVVESLNDKASRESKELMDPGCHDLLAFLGEAWCILTASRIVVDLDKLVNSSNLELSMNIMRGVSLYLKKSSSIDQPALYESIKSLCLKKAIYSIDQSAEINNTSNLKMSLELLTQLFRLTNVFEDKKSLSDYWKSLISCSAQQIEYETRVCALNLISYSLINVHSSLTIDEIDYAGLMDLLESYMDRNDEALHLAELLNRNQFVFTQSEPVFIKFWSLLFELLVQLDQESSRIMSSIVFNMISTSDNKGTKFRLDPVAMIKPALDLFMNRFEASGNQAVEFLLDQFVTCSECDSDSSQNDDVEMEMVFDKGVETVHSAHFIYLYALLGKLEHRKSTSLNEKFEIMVERLEKEIDMMARCLNSMSYNELRYSRLASHLLFIMNDSIQAQLTTENRERLDKLLDSKLKDVSTYFNSFLVNYYLKK